MSHAARACAAAACLCLLAACSLPVDVRAVILQARADAEANRWDAAAAGFAKAVETAKGSSDPDIWVDYAEALAMKQEGKLAGAPSTLVAKALAIDASHARALDLAGSAAWEAGDFRGATQHWQRLLAQLPPGSSRHAELQAAVTRAEQRARLSLPQQR